MDADAHVRVIRHDGSPPCGNWDDGMRSQSVDEKTYERPNAYLLQVHSMLASILDGAPPVLPLSDSRKNTQVILALFDAAKTGKAVRMEG